MQNRAINIYGDVLSIPLSLLYQTHIIHFSANSPVEINLEYLQKIWDMKYKTPENCSQESNQEASSLSDHG